MNDTSKPGRPPIADDGGSSAVLQQRIGAARLGKLQRIAQARGVTPAQMLRKWIDRLQEPATTAGGQA